MADKKLQIIIDLEDQFSSGMKSLRREMGLVDGASTKMASGVDKSSRSLSLLEKTMLGFLGFETLKKGFNATVGAAINFEDSLTNVAKTSGMSMQDTKMLGEELLKLSGTTRSSAASLVETATAAGRAGIVMDEMAKGDVAGAQKKLIEFTAAVDKFNVALGEDFSGGAAEATTAVLKLRNGLGDFKTEDVATDILHLGNAINALTSMGQITAPNLVEMSTRISALKGAAIVTTPQILGIAAALENAGVNAELGGRAVGDVFSKMTTETKAFAKLAKMSIGEYTNLVNTDANAALLVLLDRMRTGSLSATEFASTMEDLGLNNSGTKLTFDALIESYDNLVKLQDASKINIQETSSLQSEFDNVNNSTAANIEKMKNRLIDFAIGVGDTFLPAINNGIDGVGSFIGSMNSMMTVTNSSGQQVGIFGTFLEQIGVSSFDASGAMTFLGDAAFLLAGSIGAAVGLIIDSVGALASLFNIISGPISSFWLLLQGDAEGASLAMQTSMNNMMSAFETVSSNFNQRADNIGNAMEERVAGRTTAAMSEATMSIATSSEAINQSLMSIPEGANTAMPMLSTTMQTGVDGAKSSIDKAQPQFQTSGNMLGLGVAAGINQSTPFVVSAATRMIQQAKAAVDAEAKIHSPSEEMAYRGAMMTLGLAVGIEREAGVPVGSFTQITESLMNMLSPAIAEATGKGFELTSSFMSVEDQMLSVQSALQSNGFEVETLSDTYAALKDQLSAVTSELSSMRNVAFEGDAEFEKQNFVLDQRIKKFELLETRLQRAEAQDDIAIKQTRDKIAALRLEQKELKQTRDLQVATARFNLKQITNDKEEMDANEAIQKALELSGQKRALEMGVDLFKNNEASFLEEDELKDDSKKQLFKDEEDTTKAKVDVNKAIVASETKSEELTTAFIPLQEAHNLLAQDSLQTNALLDLTNLQALELTDTRVQLLAAGNEILAMLNNTQLDEINMKRSEAGLPMFEPTQTSSFIEPIINALRAGQSSGTTINVNVNASGNNARQIGNATAQAISFEQRLNT